MTKEQQKILSIIYSAGPDGIDVNDIAKKTKTSALGLYPSLCKLVEINAVEEFPGSIYKPSTKKLKMM